MKIGDAVVGAKVTDSWWPEKVGRVVKQSQMFIHVQWFYPERSKWKYDEEHADLFLREAKND